LPSPVPQLPLSTTAESVVGSLLGLIRPNSASYVDRILPTKYQLGININVAKALSLHVPNSMQLLANEVIE